MEGSVSSASVLDISALSTEREDKENGFLTGVFSTGFHLSTLFFVCKSLKVFFGLFVMYLLEATSSVFTKRARIHCEKVFRYHQTREWVAPSA
jgi:hypothetical protein